MAEMCVRACAQGIYDNKYPALNSVWRAWGGGGGAQDEAGGEPATIAG